MINLINYSLIDKDTTQRAIIAATPTLVADAATPVATFLDFLLLVII